ncbi:MAG: DUF4154 domain-containing protein [Candidatus Omnitrophica bacterium]|nr:DUF4154 domain-containing protein [Candidatus Omnitrophota bacterium]
MFPVRIIAIILCLSLLGGTPSMAAGIPQAELFSAIFIKALGYDRRLDNKTQQKVKIAVLAFKDDQNAIDFANEVQDVLLRLQSSYSIRQKPFIVETIFLDPQSNTSDALGQELQSREISVVLLLDKDPQRASLVTAATRKLQINSVCKERSCVMAGGSFGIVMKGGVFRMLVNMNGMLAENSDYSAKLLSLCEVVR